VTEQSDAGDLQRQIDDLVRRLTQGEMEITALGVRADASDARADASDRRADEAEHRADLAEQRADEMETRSALDREMIAELQADGVVRQDHVDHLKAALASSRTIGAAIGIIMASRHVGEAEAFTVLQHVSQNSNRKLSEIAAELVRSQASLAP
jgi:hypothetical protein